MKIPSSKIDSSVREEEPRNVKFFMIKFLNNPLMDMSCGQAGDGRMRSD